MEAGRHDRGDTWDTGQRFDDSVMLRASVKHLKLGGHFAQLVLKESQLSQVALHCQTSVG